VRKILGKSPLGRPKRGWEDNIKMYLGDISFDDGRWMELAQSRIQYRILVGEHEGKRQLRRPERKWEGNVKMS
jgi:hypothetical protein